MDLIYSHTMKYAPMLQGIHGLNNDLMWLYLKETAQLGRSDRIYWALSRIKFSHLKTLKESGYGLSDAHAKFLLKNMEALEKEEPFDINSLHKLIGALDTSIPDIEKLIFNQQSSEELWSELQYLSLLHQDFHPNPKTEPFLIYNGFAWFDLNKHYCSTEADIADHCGNRNGDDTETIWTLREVSKQNAELGQHRATFIYNSEQNFIGEMKGTSNEKPIARCHPAIVQLLISFPELKLHGGGYKPENNFSVCHLSEELYTKLMTHRPDLKN
jgi:hypothetical protein